MHFSVLKVCAFFIRLGSLSHGGFRSSIDWWPTFIILSSPSDFLSLVVFSAPVQMVPSPLTFLLWGHYIITVNIGHSVWTCFYLTFLMHTQTFDMVFLANRILSVVQCHGQRFCFVLFHHQGWTCFTVIRYKRFCVYVSVAEVCYEVISELVTFQRNLWFFHRNVYV